MADIDYAQQNKIRIALGLKPLPQSSSSSSIAVAGPKFKDHAPPDSNSSASATDGSDAEEPASTLETRTAAAHSNWNQLQDEAEAKKRKAAKAEAIKKARDKAQRFAKIEGKGLGDLSPGEEKGDVDTRAWLLGAKKRQRKVEKERSRMLEAELAERERLEGVAYGAEDLAGVKVGHEVGDFEGLEGGSEQVLTLKDTTIDENEEEGDELENVQIREMDRVRERLELKKKKPVYDPHAVEEDGSGERKILRQYDEEIEGKKRKHFVFDGIGNTTTTEGERDAKRQEIGGGVGLLKNQSISLDFFQEEPRSDYMDLSEIKIKKPRKSKKKATRQKALDDDDQDRQPNNSSAMDIDQVEMAPKPKPGPAEKDFVDDEDLQASLAAQRRAAFKKRKKQRPEDVAREIRDEGSATPGEMDVDAADAEPGLVIDETSEFVANLQRPSESEERPVSKLGPSVQNGDQRAESGEDSDVEMRQTYDGVDDEAALLARVERERSTATPDLTTTGLDEEAALDGGLGAAFNLLKQRGLVKTADSGDMNALHRDRQRFLAEKQKREAEAEQRARVQRERDRSSGKLERMSAREREEHARWENKQRDQLESRQMADVFNREYKPDVELKYVDEHGRSMSQKEAFKHLSHQFHGKGSGQLKTEKHLKKIEDEKKREAMSALDASRATGMNNAMGTTAKRNKQAGVRLG